MLLGVLVLLIGGLCYLLIRNKPEDMGLQLVERAGTKKDNKQSDPLAVKVKQFVGETRALFHLGGIGTWQIRSADQDNKQHGAENKNIYRLSLLAGD